jgi:hypothetical protein
MNKHPPSQPFIGGLMRERLRRHRADGPGELVRQEVEDGDEK